MPKTTVAGHPLHPMLLTAPAGLIPFSLIMDGAHALTGNPRYADAAKLTLAGGVVSGLAAGAAGLGDYLEIPRDSRTRRVGMIHGLLNGAALTLGAASLLRRQFNKSEGADSLAIGLNALTTGILGVSAWFGGHLVYELGMRVKGVSEVQGRPELKPPGDDSVARALDRIAS